jgi:hypothetical protein
MGQFSKIGPTFDSILNQIAIQFMNHENKKKVMEHFVDPIVSEISVPVQRYLTIFFVLLIIILILVSINTYVLLKN